MSMSILNNISAMYAQNNLNTSQAGLQNTLQQLSSGSRINSGADDAAGLAIANGLGANIDALTQSVHNASNSIGQMQVADGALAQVTSMLNRAVTLATEGSNSGLSTSQSTALNTEFTNILNEIAGIGTNTNFNGTDVFGATANIFMSDGTTASTINNTIGALTNSNIGLGTSATSTMALTGNAAAGDSVVIGTTTYDFVAAINPALNTNGHSEVLVGATSNQSLQNLANAVNGGGGAGLAYYYEGNTTANASVSASNVTNSSINLTATSAGLGGNAVVLTATVAAGVTTTGGDGTVATSGNAGTLTGGTGASLDLSTAAHAQTALTALTTAISDVAAQRGNLGAMINRVQAATTVMNTQITNLTTAKSGITDADVGTSVANMTKFNVLVQTGIAALQQSNQAMQAMLKLLQ